MNNINIPSVLNTSFNTLDTLKAPETTSQRNTRLLVLAQGIEKNKTQKRNLFSESVSQPKKGQDSSEPLEKKNISIIETPSKEDKTNHKKVKINDEESIEDFLNPKNITVNKDVENFVNSSPKKINDANQKEKCRKFQTSMIKIVKLLENSNKIIKNKDELIEVIRNFYQTKLPHDKFVHHYSRCENGCGNVFDTLYKYILKVQTLKNKTSTSAENNVNLEITSTNTNTQHLNNDNIIIIRNESNFNNVINISNNFISQNFIGDQRDITEEERCPYLENLDKAIVLVKSKPKQPYVQNGSIRQLAIAVKELNKISIQANSIAQHFGKCLQCKAYIAEHYVK